MPVAYESILPWGRSFSEYYKMFQLGPENFSQKILGVGDGASNFNFQMTQMGATVVSLDPLYAYSKEDIEKRISETYDNMLSLAEERKDTYCWDIISSVAELGKMRMEAMRHFLNDLEDGKVTGRYMNGELPELDFVDDFFDVALCSHHLFYHADRRDESYHLQSLYEMKRVAKEVRVFPLVDLNSKPVVFLDNLVAELSKKYTVSIVDVSYEFQIGANKMLVLS